MYYWLKGQVHPISLTVWLHHSLACTLPRVSLTLEMRYNYFYYNFVTGEMVKIELNKLQKLTKYRHSLYMSK